MLGPVRWACLPPVKSVLRACAAGRRCPCSDTCANRLCLRAPLPLRCATRRTVSVAQPWGTLPAVWAEDSWRTQCTSELKPPLASKSSFRFTSRDTFIGCQCGEHVAPTLRPRDRGSGAGWRHRVKLDSGSWYARNTLKSNVSLRCVRHVSQSAGCASHRVGHDSHKPLRMGVTYVHACRFQVPIQGHHPQASTGCKQVQLTGGVQP